MLNARAKLPDSLHFSLDDGVINISARGSHFQRIFRLSRSLKFIHVLLEYGLSRQLERRLGL